MTRPLPLVVLAVAVLAIALSCDMTSSQAQESTPANRTIDDLLEYHEVTTVGDVESAADELTAGSVMSLLLLLLPEVGETIVNYRTRR